MKLPEDYVAIFPTIIAVINGAMAVFSAHYPFKSLRSKQRFIIVVALLCSAAIGTTIYWENEVISAKLAERERIAGIREALGVIIQQGTHLQQRAVGLTSSDEAVNWEHEAEKLLIEKLGSSYVTRFRSISGLPVSNPPVPSFPVGAENLWIHLDRRLARLEQFSEELPRQ